MLIRAMRKRGIFSHCFGDGVRRRTNRPDCEIPHSPAFLLPGEGNGKACNADAGRCQAAERCRDNSTAMDIRGIAAGASDRG